MIKFNLSIECDDVSQIPAIIEAALPTYNVQQITATLEETRPLISAAVTHAVNTPTPVKEKAAPKSTPKTPAAEPAKLETPVEEKTEQKDETTAAASKAPAKLEWADIRPKCMEVTKQLKEWKVERPGDLINQARTEVLPGSEHLAALEKHPELWAKMWETVDALLVTHKPA